MVRHLTNSKDIKTKIMHRDHGRHHPTSFTQRHCHCSATESSYFILQFLTLSASLLGFSFVEVLLCPSISEIHAHHHHYFKTISYLIMKQGYIRQDIMHTTINQPTHQDNNPPIIQQSSSILGIHPPSLKFHRSGSPLSTLFKYC